MVLRFLGFGIVGFGMFILVRNSILPFRAFGSLFRTAEGLGPQY